MVKEFAPIGIFDSGYGGLTIFEEIRRLLPAYDYIYLGDNARTPYGSRSFEIVYHFTREAVLYLFEQGCPLVILACNTASAKALRTIQQDDLPLIDATKRVLGVIRPTIEMACKVSRTNHIGVLGTTGTINSRSYELEIAKLYPHMHVRSEACPMWVPLVENNEFNSPGADYFIRKHIKALLDTDRYIDTLLLACTHYPLLMDKILQFIPSGITILSQGKYVAESLKDYLFRHPDMEQRLTKNATYLFQTTESTDKFMEFASVFLTYPVQVEHITLQ